jgi:hypothetical protein
VATELFPKPIIGENSIAGSFDISIAWIYTRGIMKKVISFYSEIPFLKLTVAYLSKQFSVFVELYNRGLLY